jgi:hypothetical protein
MNIFKSKQVEKEIDIPEPESSFYIPRDEYLAEEQKLKSNL